LQANNTLQGVGFSNVKFNINLRVVVQQSGPNEYFSLQNRRLVKELEKWVGFPG